MVEKGMRKRWIHHFHSSLGIKPCFISIRSLEDLASATLSCQTKALNLLGISRETIYLQYTPMLLDESVLMAQPFPKVGLHQADIQTVFCHQRVVGPFLDNPPTI